MRLTGTAGRGAARLGILLYAVAALSGCDAVAGPGNHPPSTLSFTYGGTRSGTYSVRGDIPAETGDGSVFSRTWATGDRFHEGGREYVYLLANRPSTAGTWDGVQILIPADGRGTYALDGQSSVVFDYDDPQDPLLLHRWSRGGHRAAR